jgi:hypothetical protein
MLRRSKWSEINSKRGSGVEEAGESIWDNLKYQKSESKGEYNIPEKMAPRALSGHPRYLTSHTGSS